jgi:hypothetical protein
MERETIIAALAERGMCIDENNFLRHVRMAPYIEGMPTFDLVTWDTNRRFATGQWKIGVALMETGNLDPIFCHEEIGCAPSDPVDSDAALRGVMGWLTLRPGDTDADYFADYTERQHAFASAHAETLNMWGMEESSFDDAECGAPAFVNIDENGAEEIASDE